MVVVGLDLRKPTIHKFVTLDNEDGVTDYLIGKRTLNQIIHATATPNLMVIPSGQVPPNPAELIETPKFEQLIEDLRKRFEIILLDTPPVGLVTDATLISRHADANLYVVRQHVTRRDSLTMIHDLQSREHIKNLSVIINDMVIPRYYGYRYGYAYGYGYGYGHRYGSDRERSYYVEE